MMGRRPRGVFDLDVVLDVLIGLCLGVDADADGHARRGRIDGGGGRERTVGRHPHAAGREAEGRCRHSGRRHHFRAGRRHGGRRGRGGGRALPASGGSPGGYWAASCAGCRSRARDSVSPVASISAFVRAPIGKSPRSSLAEPLTAGPLPATRTTPARLLYPFPFLPTTPTPLGRDGVVLVAGKGPAVSGSAKEERGLLPMGARTKAEMLATGLTLSLALLLHPAQLAAQYPPGEPPLAGSALPPPRPLPPAVPRPARK